MILCTLGHLRRATHGKLLHHQTERRSNFQERCFGDDFLLTKLFDWWSKWGVWMTDFEMWWRFLFIQEARLAIIRPSVKAVEYLCKRLTREEVGVDPLFRTPLPAFSDQCNAHWVPRQTLKIPLTVVKGGARVVIRCLQLMSALACGWVEPSSIGQPHLNPTQGCQSRLRWWWRKYIF